jgi:hypothetical protein
MNKVGDVLKMLIPQGGWAYLGDDYEGIQFIECEPITKKQFEDGLKVVDAWKAQQEADRTATKNAILDRLGITAQEARLLLS